MVHIRSLSAVIVLSLVTCLGSAFAAPLTLRFATVAPDGTSWAKEMEKWGADVAAATNNEVQIKIYSSSRMGDEVDVLRKMRSGQLHAGAFSNIGLGQIDPSSRALDLLFLFQSDEEEDYVLERIYPKLEPRFAKHGMKLASLSSLGKIYLYSKTPIRNLAEGRAQKMWLWDTDLLTRAFYEQAQITPVPLAIPDVFTALQTGMITGVYMLPVGAIGFQWWQSLKYISMPHITNAAAAIMFNQKDWERISPLHRKKISDLTWEVGKRFTKTARDDNAKAIEILKKNGFQVAEIAPNDLQEFKAAALKTRKVLTGKSLDPEILAEIDRLLAEYRAKGAKPEAMAKRK